MYRKMLVGLVMVLGLLLGSSGIVQAFTTADLEGTWYGHGLVSGDAPAAQFIGWEYYSAVIDSNGNFTHTSYLDSSGDTTPGPLTFLLNITNDGIITVPEQPSRHGIMNPGKDMVVLTGDDGQGGYELGVLVKGGGTFTIADLEGTWYFHALMSGDAPQCIGWFYGTGTIDSNGNFTQTSLLQSNGDTGEGDTDLFNITADGIITEPAEPFAHGIIHGIMNLGKDMMVLTSTMIDDEGNEDGYWLMVMVKGGGTFTIADLEGTWNYHGLISGDAPDQTPGWYYGQFIIDSTGNVTFTTPVTDSLGNSYFTGTGTPGIMNISAEGIITIAGVEGDYRWVMSGNKDMIVGVHTGAPGDENDVHGYNLIVLVKNEEDTTETVPENTPTDVVVSDGSGVNITTNPGSGDVDVSVTESYDNSYGYTGMADGQGLDRTLEITSDAEDGSFVAVVKFAYTDEELADSGISEENIRIYCWDDDTQTWVIEGTTDVGNSSSPDPATVIHVGWYGVDTDNNFAWVVVDHLSIFGLGGIEEEEEEEEEEGDGGGGGGGGGGCFIATACFGTPMANEVITLRQFRDECLLTNPVGKVFVSTYYKISPPIADFIREHPLLKSMVRSSLKPLIWLARECES